MPNRDIYFQTPAATNCISWYIACFALGVNYLDASVCLEESLPSNN